jgi:choline monooxygenase
VRLERWGPFLFVNAHAEAAPLAETLGDVPAQVAELGLDVDELRFHHRSEWSVAANWKVVAENFLECYHCAVAHPSFTALVDVSPEAYRLEIGRLDSTQIGPARDGETRSQFHFVWPNTGVNVFPGEANLSIGPIVSASPERTDRFLDYFFGAGVDDSWIADLLDLDDQVGREDTALVERVQTGVASGALAEGRLLGEAEQLVAHFQGLVREALA